MHSSFGSGNDIAASLNILPDLDSCCKAIKKGSVKRIDLGLINSKYYYLGVAGADFDSIVTDLANNTKFPIKGPAKYTYAVYRTLITYRSKIFYISFFFVFISLKSAFTANFQTHQLVVRYKKNAPCTYRCCFKCAKDK